MHFSNLVYLVEISIFDLFFCLTMIYRLFKCMFLPEADMDPVTWILVGLLLLLLLLSNRFQQPFDRTEDSIIFTTLM